MLSETVSADWVSGNVFLLHDRFEFPVVMTQPRGVNGADLLPLSLIGCSAWDVMGILQKQRQPVAALTVTGTCTRDPEPPRRYRAIHIHYRFTGQGLDPARIRRAIELSETKYCSIYVTLRDAMTLTSDFEIAEAEASGAGRAMTGTPVEGPPAPHQP
jgi:putative redox protein